MSYEIFDDVAFMYLALAVLAVAVLPWSAFKLFFFVKGLLVKPTPIPLTRIQKLKLAQKQVKEEDVLAEQESTRKKAPWLSLGNVSLLLLWLLFAYLLVQIPSFSSENLATFQPYEILKVDPKASDEDIKRAYRKQSLLFHPDRNPSPEAAQQFILIAKAYETLTSDTAKANIEKYGNPDGYQGVSVTIGLPSILTKKENELRVLVLYFCVFMVLPPCLVWVWWRRAKDFVEGGILKKTLALWYQLMLPNQGAKFLIEFLSIASENEALLGPDHPTDVDAFKKLVNEVKPNMVKQRFQETKMFGTYFQYAHKASVLFHAYLLRLPIPQSLRADVDWLLKDAHRLLNVMLDLSLSRAFVRTVFGIFDLMQMLTQGLFAHDSPLLQLPHLTPDDVRRLARKNIKTVHQLLKATPEKLSKQLPDLTEKQWEEIRSTAELIPAVELHSEYGVEDEEGLYEGDLITLKLHLERVSFDPDKPDEPQQYRLSQHEGDQDAPAAAAEKDEQSPSPTNTDSSSSNKKKKDNGPAAGKDQAASAKVSASPEAASSSSSSSSSTASPSSPPADLTDDEILDSIPIPKKVARVPDLKVSGPSVHSLTFPHVKHEKWFVLLVEKSHKKMDRIIGFQRIANFFDETNIELKFLAPRAKSAKEDGLKAGDASAGIYEYEVHAICDSYVGVDVVRTLKIKVDKPKVSEEEAARIAASKVQEEYEELAKEELAEEEEEYIGQWYYLGFASFWELALNALVLGLLCVFIFNFLVSRGYWQRYIQPCTDFVSAYTTPLLQAIYPFVAPVLDPLLSALHTVYDTTSNMLHRDPFPKMAEDSILDDSQVPGMGQED